MTTKDIRTRMMAYIADVEPKKLKALYTLLVEDEDKKPLKLSDEQMAILNKRRADYLSGKSKARPWKEVHEKIRSKKKSK